MIITFHTEREILVSVTVLSSAVQTPGVSSIIWLQTGQLLAFIVQSQAASVCCLHVMIEEHVDK